MALRILRLLCALGALHAGQALAVACATVATGNWNVQTTWGPAGTGCAGAPGGIPGAADTVTINAGHLVSITNTPITVLAITAISGTLRYTGAAKAFTVNGSVSLNAGGIFDVSTASNATHTLAVAGNFANAGTVDFAPTGAGSNEFVNVTFNGAGTQTVSGAGATFVFNRITVNPAGASIANIVDVTAAAFAFRANATSGVTITDGTFRVSAAVTIAPFDNGPIAAEPDDYIIPANGRFWLNNAGAVVNYSQAGAPAAANHISVDGVFRIDAGSFNLGNASDERMRIRPTGAGGTFEMNGGALNIAGRLTSVAVGDDGTFTITGGTITVGIVGNTIATFGPVFIGSACTFNMSGGTIAIRRASTAAANEYDNRAPVSAVTGGTVQIGDAGTPAGQTMQASSVPRCRTSRSTRPTTRTSPSPPASAWSATGPRTAPGPSPGRSRSHSPAATPKRSAEPPPRPSAA